MVSSSLNSVDGDQGLEDSAQDSVEINQDLENKELDRAVGKEIGSEDLPEISQDLKEAKLEQPKESLEDWLRAELGSSPLREQGFGPLIDQTIQIVLDLRQRLDKATWLRLLKGGRMLKELNEVLPVVSRFLAYLEGVEVSEGQGITVVDLGSGIGYLSILLSELLRGSSKIDRFVLVDSRWPMLNAETKPHHISPMHLKQELWPFELAYRKYDLKSSSGQRQLQAHILSPAPGPVALLGVHLCGLLSLHTVHFFNEHPRCTFLAVKPCCLPPIDLAKAKFVWTVGGQSIQAANVCGPSKYNRGKLQSPIKQSAIRVIFMRWASSLLESIEVGVEGRRDLAEFTIVNVPENKPARYQTLFAFADRPYCSSEGSVTNMCDMPADVVTSASPSMTAVA